MKAAQITSYGVDSPLEVREIEKPSLTPTQVLVQVHAASINPFDVAVRSGAMKDAIPLDLPATLGGDLSGTVSEVGDEVTGFEVGERVFGFANPVSGSGSFAEFAPAESASLASIPQQLDFATAAAIPLAACSAYQALVDHMHLKSGDHVLIHGGAGGIGSYAIQIAKEIGAQVTTTAATDDIDFVKSLGADEAIDFKTQDFETEAKDLDAVFDTVGGDTTLKSARVLKAGGTLVSMRGDNEEAKKLNINYVAQVTKVTSERLNNVAELIVSESLEPQVGQNFPLSQITEAMAFLSQGKQRGKIVVTVVQ